MKENQTSGVPPWDYNPSSWKARIPICLLAFVAFAISCYLALYQMRVVSTVWDPVFGSGTREVLDSDVSGALRRWFYIPDAALGALAYLGDIVFGLLGGTQRWRTKPWLVVLFGIDVIPLGIVSAILVGLQGYMVGAWCFLCLVTAFISLILVVMSYDEVWSSLLYLHRLWRKNRNKKEVWHAFLGRK